MQKLFLILLLLSSFFIISCDDNNSVGFKILILSSDEYSFIDSVDIPGDFNIQLYKKINEKDEITNGFNQFLVAIYDYKSKNFISNAKIECEVKFNNQKTISPSYLIDGITLEYLYQIDTYLGKSNIEDDFYNFNFSLGINERQITAQIKLKDYVPSFDLVQYFEIDSKIYQLTFLHPITPEVGFNEIHISAHKILQDTFDEELDLEFIFELLQDNIQITSGISNPILINSERGIYSGSLILQNANTNILKVHVINNSSTVSQKIFNLITKF